MPQRFLPNRRIPDFPIMSQVAIYSFKTFNQQPSMRNESPLISPQQEGLEKTVWSQDLTK
jgi:hypothetical protein